MSDTQLVSKSDAIQQSVIDITPQIQVGGKELLIIGGPCTVESLDQMEQTARHLSTIPVQLLRGGVYKPRTSPYSFQGLGPEGITIFKQVRQRYNIPFVTEVMSIPQLEAIVDAVDVLQIGSRNMQNFELLKAVGQVNKPVILKRGLSATIQEFLLAAEYILSGGNSQVILCERGIRSFDSYTRNVLDLGAVVGLKQLTHLPVIVDPSHAAGKRELVANLAKAAVAAGADGVMIECHPQPEKSVSDARQALSLEEMTILVTELKSVAAAVGRRIVEAEPLERAAA
ncbi:MAG: 3-deoxy-7-phosphoheptulonate synthase [Microcoleaceae cyanobacterium]